MLLALNGVMLEFIFASFWLRACSFYAYYCNDLQATQSKNFILQSLQIITKLLSYHLD